MLHSTYQRPSNNLLDFSIFTLTNLQKSRKICHSDHFLEVLSEEIVTTPEKYSANPKQEEDDKRGASRQAE